MRYLILILALTVPDLTLILLAPAYTYAQEDEPVPEPIPSPSEGPLSQITGMDGEPIPQKVQIGEPIYLSASKAVYARKRGSILWKVFPPERGLTARHADNGELFIIGTGNKPGLVITVQQIVTINDIVATTEIEIYVEGASPPNPHPDPMPTPVPKPIPTPDNPEPVPDPNPAPTPAPDALTGALQKACKDFLSETPPEDRKAVAVVFRQVAKQAKDGQIQTMAAFLKGTADGMRGTVGVAGLMPWLEWRDAFTDILTADGRYKTPQDHVAIWNLLADMLEGGPNFLRAKNYKPKPSSSIQRPTDKLLTRKTTQSP